MMLPRNSRLIKSLGQAVEECRRWPSKARRERSSVEKAYRWCIERRSPMWGKCFVLLRKCATLSGEIFLAGTKLEIIRGTKHTILARVWGNKSIVDPLEFRRGTVRRCWEEIDVPKSEDEEQPTVGL